MQKKTIMINTLLSSLLFFTFSACTSTPFFDGRLKTQKPIERLVNEPLKEFGQRVCNIKGEGIHFRITDAKYKKNLYQVKCEENRGIQVSEVNNTYFSKRFNYPVPTLLESNNIDEYLNKKKVILFGEDHGEDKRFDVKIFVSTIKYLKRAGFTHIGLETDKRYQELITFYVNNPSIQNKNVLFRDLPLYKFTIEDKLLIVDEAIKYDMQVVCIDDWSLNKTKPRDVMMKDEIMEIVKEDGRIAVYNGKSHIRWSKLSESMYWGDEKVGGLQPIRIFKPLGRYLLESLNKKDIGLIDLTECNDSYIFACMKTELEN
jgi:hypothetical protein